MEKELKKLIKKYKDRLEIINDLHKSDISSEKQKDIFLVMSSEVESFIIDLKALKSLPNEPKVVRNNECKEEVCVYRGEYCSYCNTDTCMYHTNFNG